MTPTLREYQREGVKFLSSRARACLFDAPGLGKTAQVLMALPPGVGACVVCPEIAKTVWQDQAALWRPDLRVTVLYGRRSWRWPTPGELVVLNYELLPPGAGPAPPGTVVVADEGHYLKTATSQRTRRFRILRDRAFAAGGRVWVLTGTPLLREPPDLWSVLAAAGCSEMVFGSWMGFCRSFHARTEEIRVRGGARRRVTIWGQPDASVPQALQRACLWRRREEVLPELPPKTLTALRVACVTPEAAAACDAVVRELGPDPEAALERLQEEGGIEFGGMSSARAALALLKIPAMLQVVQAHEEAGLPLVVFSAHRAPIEALAARPGWGAVLGGAAGVARAWTVMAFQEGRLRGIALTIGAGRESISLTRAADVLFVDRDWTAAHNVQAEDRVMRPPQRKPVNVTVLQADHDLDRMVEAVIQRKMKLVEATFSQGGTRC